MQGIGGERAERGKGGERESQADLLLSAEPHTGLDLRTLRSQSELGSRVRRSTD